VDNIKQQQPIRQKPFNGHF